MDLSGDNSRDTVAMPSAWPGTVAPAATTDTDDHLVVDASDADSRVEEIGRANVVRRHYGRSLRILLVTDDLDEATAFLAAAEESVLDAHVEVQASVDAALAHIQRVQAARRRRAVPDVVVAALEISESHRLLAALSDPARLETFPVVVLSDEIAPALERRSFALGAAGHMRIPDRAYQRVALVHTLPDFLPQVRSAVAD